MADLRAAAQAVLDRLDSPQWEWAKQGPTADLMAELRAALAQAEPVQPAAGVDAYDMIDRFLRNNLRDDDYAEYSAALDSLYTAPPPQQQQAEPVAWMESPYGVIRANPAYKIKFPSQLLHWQIPLFIAPQQAEPCDMGQMCLNCQPRGPNGECPDKQAARLETARERVKARQAEPVQRKPLTEEEIHSIAARCAAPRWKWIFLFTRFIEQAHGIKEAK